MKTIDDLGDVRGRRVLVRSDLNVPLRNGVITDDGRIRASVPTIAQLAERGARVIVCAHLGRPKGQVRPEFSLRPVAARLGELLGTNVRFAADTVGDSAREAVAALADGEVALLENLRFEAGETSKDDDVRGAFAEKLAGLADIYVGDGFGAVHRKHASVYDVPGRLPHAAGGLIEAEVGVLRRLTEDPPRPYVVVLGGAKVSDKLGVIANLLGTVDRLLIGGGMMFTFLKAQGREVGGSLLEADQVEECRRFIAEAAERGVELVLPVDTVTGTGFPSLTRPTNSDGPPADTTPVTVDVNAIPADRLGLDIGPKTAELFVSKLSDARTVFWNGPMGVFESAEYAEGTRRVAGALAESSAYTVVGGGDSAAAVRALGIAEGGFSHISTGGGASLEYLEGKALPGLQALED